MRRLGVYARLGDRIDLAVNERIQRLGRRLLDDLHAGVTDVQPSYTTLYVEYDARRAERADIERWMAGHLAARAGWQGDAGGSFVRVPVRYDGEDIAAVCEATGLARHELIDLHSGRDYRVFAVGASPGFPFLGVLDERLRMARHPTPRSVVPAHSVAMTGLQTGIYPVAGPGGWQLLGHALRAVYDPWREQPFLIAPGDTVRLEPEDGEVPPDAGRAPLLPAAPERPALRVDEAGPARPRRRRRPPHGRALRHGAVGPGGRARGAPRQRAGRQRPLRAAARADRARPVADRSAPRAHRRHGARRAALDRQASRPRP